jgi:formylmethanofuran dehydrogenase subunit E
MTGDDISIDMDRLTVTEMSGHVSPILDIGIRGEHYTSETFTKELITDGESYYIMFGPTSDGSWCVCEVVTVSLS